MEDEYRLDIARCWLEVYVNDKLLIKEFIKSRKKRKKRMMQLTEILQGTSAYFIVRHGLMKISIKKIKH